MFFVHHACMSQWGLTVYGVKMLMMVPKTGSNINKKINKNIT